MNDFIQTFSFVVMPFLVMLTFSVILPAAGSALYIRNEMMLAIALPPLSGAALTLGVACGLPPGNHAVLFIFSFVVVYGIVTLLGGLRLSEIKRQILQASLFAAGTALTHLVMSVSPEAHAHLQFLLTGELLSLGPAELSESLVLCVTGSMLFLLYRNAVFSYCIDEETMRLRTVRFRTFTVIYRLMITLLISAAVPFIGPLLTSALLIFPPLFSDNGRNSIGAFFITGMIIGISGAAAGFAIGVGRDIPPAYSGAIGILIPGIGYKLITVLISAGRKNIRKKQHGTGKC